MSENVKEIIAWLGALGIPSIFTMTAWCIRSCCHYTKQLKVLAKAQQAQMRSQLLEQYHFYMDSGWILEEHAADKAGIPVNHTQAKRMMLNEKYLGTDYYPAIVTKELMDKVRDELLKRATALGRIFEPTEKKEEKKVAVFFTLGRVENRYTDPYEQAEFAYSLIEEVQMDG